MLQFVMKTDFPLDLVGHYQVYLIPLCVIVTTGDQSLI